MPAPLPWPIPRKAPLNFGCLLTPRPQPSGPRPPISKLPTKTKSGPTPIPRISELGHRASTLIAGFTKANTAISERVRNNTRYSLTAPAQERALQDSQILVLSDAIQAQKDAAATLATAVIRAEYNALVARKAMLAALAMVEGLRLHRQIEALKLIDPAARVDYTIGKLTDLCGELSELNLECIRKEQEIH